MSRRGSEKRRPGLRASPGRSHIRGRSRYAIQARDHDGLRTFALAFADGDELPEAIERFASDESVEAASFEAIGAFDRVTLGYFDLKQKDYTRHPLEEQVEVLSLVGNVATKNGEPVVHAHVLVGRSDATTRGGHLLAGRVRPTLELMLAETPAQLRKQEDPETGLALLRS